MALTKVHSRMFDKQPLSLIDFGAVGDGVTDDTSAFTAAAAVAVAQNRSLYVPDGTYLLSDVDLSSTAGLRGINIECGSNTFFTAPDNTTDIFNIGGQRRMNFLGGQFLKANRCFYTDNALAPAYCRFERLRFRPAAASDIKVCFEAETSIGNTFLECQFGWDQTADGIDTGVDFLASSAGETNVNRFLACTFINFKNYAYRQRGSAYRKASNTFVGCWFEDSAGVAIDAGQNTFSFTAIGCYFENVGSASSTSPIVINLSTQVAFKDCFFTGLPVGATSWISSTNSNIITENCTVFLRGASSQKFVAFGTTTANQRLSDTFLIDSDGGADFRTLLFSNSTASEADLVEWDIRRNSSTTIGDDYPKRFDPSRYVDSYIKSDAADGWARFFTNEIVLSVDGTWYDMADITIAGSASTGLRLSAQTNTTHQGVGAAARFIEVWIIRSAGTVSITSITNVNVGGGIELQVVADGTNAKLQGRRVGGASSTAAALVEIWQADGDIADRRAVITDA